MTQKRLIYADEKDKIRMICENLRASDASAFDFRSYRRAVVHGVCSVNSRIRVILSIPGVLRSLHESRKQLTITLCP
ncbi:MAG: hypothetical protein DSY55_02260 [Clostridia bacterium]|nr:MAG: hypothetical protein DSY55_02260 [Clostridia bacterium]